MAQKPGPLTTSLFPRRLVVAALAALPLLVAGLRMLPAPAGAAEKDPFSPEEAARYIGADGCGECHQAAVDAWMESAHFTSFTGLHRSAEGKAITDKLGIRRIKAEAQCASCHYTAIEEEGRVRAKYAVSCESCHGAAKNWVKIHDDYGGMDITRETETAAHRKQRFEKSAAAGMNHSEDVYRLVAQCYACHVVGNESIVEKGGHPSGSPIELVAWTQGEVRHNYLATDGKMNEHITREEARRFYVAGWALDLEYSLRAAAKASKDGPYFVAMSARVKNAHDKLAKIQRTHQIAEVGKICEILNGVHVTLGATKALSAASDKIAAQTRAFLQRSDGSELAAIDSLLPTKDQYRGKARE